MSNASRPPSVYYVLSVLILLSSALLISTVMMARLARERYQAQLLLTQKLRLQQQQIHELDAEATTLRQTLAEIHASHPELAVESTASTNPTEFTVILTSFGSTRPTVAKAVQELTGLGETESLELLDATPVPLKRGVSAEEASDVKSMIEQAGGSCEIRPTKP